MSAASIQAAAGRLRLAAGRLVPIAFFAVLAPFALAALLVKEWRDGRVAPDLQLGLYRQASDLIHTGVAFDPVGTVIDGQNRVYTVLTTLLATPLTLLPVGAAAALMTALLIGAALATPYLVGVRDPRVFACILLWPPVLSGIQSGNLTLLLGLLAALAWRTRERRFAPGLLIGLAAAAKVFMWPLAVWLLVTRRVSATLAAAAVGLASIALIVPFGNPVDYFRIAASNAQVLGRRAFSLYPLLGSDTLARAAWAVLAALALVAIVLAARQPGAGGEASSFALALLASILCSPIVWLHYFALLLVPLAIARPRMGPLWLVPLAYWLVPFGTPQPWQIVVALATAFSLTGALVLRRPARVGDAAARTL